MNSAECSSGHSFPFLCDLLLALSEAEEHQPRDTGLNWGGSYLSSVLLGVSSSPLSLRGYPQDWEVSLFHAAVLSGELWDPLEPRGFCALQVPVPCKLEAAVGSLTFFTPQALGAGAH